MTNHREEFDAIIIGVGQAGNPLASALSRAGWRTALVERRFVGGTCINDGCTPTKTMIASGRVAYVARRAGDYGVHVDGVGVDMAEVRRRKQEIVDASRSSIHRRLSDLEHVELIYGEARFDGHKSVAVATQEGSVRRLGAHTIFINTGARPAQPHIRGLESTPSLDSTTILELDETPEHLVVLGGGYIGIEFGQLFRRLGSRVTILQRSEQILTREDPDIAAAVTDILREDGVEILLETRTERVERNAAGGVVLTVQDARGERELYGSHLLVATGRTPNTDRLNLAAAGVDSNDKGYIRVNERLATSADGIYALGEVRGAPAFTHIAYDDYRIVKDHLLEGGQRTAGDVLVPYTIFTDPQLGRVGMSEKEAGEQGRRVRVATMPMSSVARANEVGETRGMMKALVDSATDQILGCAILGVEGGEIMAMLQIAMMGRVPYTVLRDGVFAHPTLAESLNTLFTELT